MKIAQWPKHVFGLLLFPLFGIGVLVYPQWSLALFSFFVAGSGVFLRRLCRLYKGKFMLVWLLSVTSLAFLHVIAGDSIPPWVVISILTLLVWGILVLTSQARRGRGSERRKSLEIGSILAMFLGLSSIFGILYMYSLPWTVGLVLSVLFLGVILQLVGQLMGVTHTELWVPVMMLILLEATIVYTFLPLSHTIMAASLVVMSVVSVTLYQHWVRNTWQWLKAVRYIGLGIGLEGVLFFTGI